MLRALYDSHNGDGIYQKRFDLNADGAIDLLDAQAIRVPYGTTCTDIEHPNAVSCAYSDARANTGARANAARRLGVPGDVRWRATSPQNYLSSRFDMVVGSNDADAVIDGQVLVSDPPLVLTYGTIEAGHGPDCGAPIGTTQNNHNIPVDFDPQGFQTNTRPQLAYICKTT